MRIINKFNLELTNYSIARIGNKACELYSDYDMPVNKCIEKYLIDFGLSNDDAYNLALDLSDEYNKLNYLGLIPKEN